MTPLLPKRGVESDPENNGEMLGNFYREFLVIEGFVDGKAMLQAFPGERGVYVGG